MPRRNGFSELAANIFASSDDSDKLKKLLTTEYTANDLIDYLQHDDPLVSRSAASALGLIADMDAVPALVETLRNTDVKTSMNSEIALWAIWSRSGDESVDELFNVGKTYLKREDYFEAIDVFTKVIEAAPDFAEGYNQRAVAYFVLEDWKNALEDCKKTIELNPHHFGAFAGMGHVYLRLRKIDEAVNAYKQALAINPNLISVAQSLLRLHRETEENQDE